MKKVIVFIGTVLYSMLSMGQNEIKVASYQVDKDSKEKVYLKMDFGKYDLNGEKLSAIEPDRIAKVEIICTDYPRGINLTTLNQNRFEELKKNYPSLNNKYIEYKTIRQTDFKGKNEAKKMFHGVVITYLNGPLEVLRNQNKYVNNKFDVPESFLVKTELITIDAKKESAVKVGKRGTVMHVPKDAFVDKNGKLVEGKVELAFSEYTNSAEIAFSGIPMNYTQNGEKTCFNSSGMFSITGTSEGEDVSIAKDKSLSFDYAIAKQNENIDFYQLKSDSSDWELISEIDEVAKQKVVIPAQEKLVDSIGNHEIIDGEFLVANGKMLFVQGQVQNAKWTDDGNRTGATLLAEGADAGHTYPSIVKGLNTKSFGVYNCDQVYRIKNKVNIVAHYFDEDGNEIKNGKVLSMIDLEYNGAFSYAPANFTCNAKGNNVLLLFTKNNEMYLLGKGEFQAMGVEENGTYNFKMTKVTDKITSSAALSNYLGLN